LVRTERCPVSRKNEVVSVKAWPDMMKIHKLVNPIDLESLKNTLEHAKGFPHFCIDNFLVDDFASEIEASFPG